MYFWCIRYRIRYRIRWVFSCLQKAEVYPEQYPFLMGIRPSSSPMLALHGNYIKTLGQIFL